VIILQALRVSRFGVYGRNGFIRLFQCLFDFAIIFKIYQKHHIAKTFGRIFRILSRYAPNIILLSRCNDYGIVINIDLATSINECEHYDRYARTFRLGSDGCVMSRRRLAFRRLPDANRPDLDFTPAPHYCTRYDYSATCWPRRLHSRPRNLVHALYTGIRRNRRNQDCTRHGCI
jgi:hypothetical protein